ncbi:MAG: phosphatase PAP2 family protein [Firmicutes bacterium]|nr:phosphatase PAP2 family protein [Bacillota bacterium]
MILMTRLFRAFLKIDLSILNYIQAHMTNPILDKVMPIITRLGSGGIIWICLSVSCMLTKKYRRAGVTVAIALILSLIICNLTIKPIAARIRPFLIGAPPDKLMITPPSDFSFPSGHTTASFAAAVSVWLCGGSALAYFALAAAALIGFSRLYLYVHYPSDVIFGALLGTAIGIAAFSLTALFFTKQLPL